MSFASDVKNEICKLDLEDICCTRAELAGLVCFAAQISAEGIRINTESSAVASRIVLMIKRLYNLRVELVTRESSILTAKISGAEAVKILRDMKLGTIPIRIDKDIIRRECCKRAFIRGAFLGGGSVSSPEKGYHMEFVTSHYAL